MPVSRLEAVVWDMDGVIADTARYHFQAWQEIFQERGIDFTKEVFKRYFGRRNDTIIRDNIGREISSEEVYAIADEKEERYRRLMAHDIKSLPGAIELLGLLGESGVKMAVASSAPLENIELITRSLGIYNCFQAIVWGGEVAESKPSPQGFLLAAEKLGVEPRNCLVAEDAVAGVAAAKRGGMKCLAVTTSHPEASLKEADLVVDTLEAVGLDDLERLFGSPREA